MDSPDQRLAGLDPIQLGTDALAEYASLLPLYHYYHYSYDQTHDATTWNAFWLYWHHSDPAETRDTFFPLGSLRRNPNEQAWSFSALGLEPVSLLQISKSQTTVQNRFSPLWDYHSEGSNWGPLLAFGNCPCSPMR